MTNRRRRDSWFHTTLSFRRSLCNATCQPEMDGYPQSGYSAGHGRYAKKPVPPQESFASPHSSGFSQEAARQEPRARHRTDLAEQVGDGRRRRCSSGRLQAATRFGGTTAAASRALPGAISRPKAGKPYHYAPTAEGPGLRSQAVDGGHRDDRPVPSIRFVVRPRGAPSTFTRKRHHRLQALKTKAGRQDGDGAGRARTRPSRFKKAPWRWNTGKGDNLREEVRWNTTAGGGELAKRSGRPHEARFSFRVRRQPRAFSPSATCLREGRPRLSGGALCSRSAGGAWTAFPTEPGRPRRLKGAADRPRQRKFLKWMSGGRRRRRRNEGPGR